MLRTLGAENSRERAEFEFCADGLLRNPVTGALKPEPLPGQRYGAAAPACDFAGCTWRACLTGPGGNWCGIHREPMAAGRRGARAHARL